MKNKANKGKTNAVKRYNGLEVKTRHSLFTTAKNPPFINS
jgi:hypothetical protein